MDGITLEKIHEEVSSIKKDLNKIRAYFEEDELELSYKIKKQIIESRKRPISGMIPQGEVEKRI